MAAALARRRPGSANQSPEAAARRVVQLLVFLRMCEGHGLLPTGTLQALAGGDNAARRLYQWLDSLERQLGPGLFQVPQEDGGHRLQHDGLLILQLDDEPLNQAVLRLYDPGALARVGKQPVELLGRIHEHLLGKRLRQSPRGRLLVEAIAAARKPSGVFYTPQCVTRYIVDQTVGKRLAQRAARQSKDLELAILDPACGGGWFLLAACRCLLQWCRQQRVRGRQQTVARQLHGVDVDPEAVLTARRSLWLELAADHARQHRRCRTWEPSAPGDILHHLAENIRCGDALAGRVLSTPALPMERVPLAACLPVRLDRSKCNRMGTLAGDCPLFRCIWGPFSQQTLTTKKATVPLPAKGALAGPEAARVDKPPVAPKPPLSRQDQPGRYCTATNLLPETCADDGQKPGAKIRTGAAARFDVVIANPPYQRELGTRRLMQRLAATPLGRKYRAPRMDLWYYFVHRGLELLKPGGCLSLIVGSYWTAGRGAEKLIRALRRSAHVDEIFLLDRSRVFPNVAGRHMILTVTKGTDSRPTIIKRAAGPGPTEAEPLLCGTAPLVVFEKTARQLFRAGRIDVEPPADALLAKLAGWPLLAELGKVRQGIAENPASITRKTSRQHGNRWEVGRGVFALGGAELAQLNLPPRETRLLRPYYDLCDLGRYWIADQPSLVLIYSTRQTCPRIDQYPALRRHLSRFRPIMEARRETRQGCRAWWQLHWPREETLWLSPKVISVQMGARPAFVPALRPAYVPFSTNVFVPADSTAEHLYYFAAILNSRLAWKWFLHHGKRRGVGLEINGQVLARMPIRTIDFSNPAQRARHDRLVELAGQMLVLKRDLRATGSLASAALQSQAVDLDRQIDRLVYELYELTGGEIALVETSCRAATAAGLPGG